MTLFTHRRTIDGSHDNDNDTEEPGPKPKDKSYCLPKLILYLVAVATIGTNLRSILNLDEGNRVGVGVGVMAVNRNRTKRTTTIIQLASTSTNNTHTLAEYSSAGSFFDCNRTQSKCRYFYPGAFFRQYFETALRQTTSSSSSSSSSIGSGNGDSIYHQSNNASSSEQQYLEWRKHIGLDNANLPALDSLSWWAEKEGDNSNIDGSGNERSILNHQLLSHQIQTHINIPSNITYIHVHKCGGTSIQGALYRSARRIRNTRFQIINNGSTRSDDNNNNRSNNNNNNHNQQQLIQIQANVHTYKHSYGGGSREKKERWDKERLDHIHAISDINNETRSVTSSFPLFTVVRDPIQRFLSAVQQVMHYNTEFREKCLKDSLASSTLSTSTVSSSSSSIIAPLLLSKKSKEEKEAQLRRQTIQCAIRDMEETTYRRDVHLLPMASHFRLMGDDDATTEDDEVGTNGSGNGSISKDIPISVFFMEDIEDVLLHLGNVVVKDDDNISNTTSKKSIIHARDRSNVEYATSSILARLSSNDCDNEMIQQICNLYHVDVELIKWLGFGCEAVERCE